MSTRTSIRIGSILDSSMKERLPGYTRVLEEYTHQYLLFGYQKAVLGHYYATVLFQASKSFGGITCEVGLSRSKEFPYYRFFDRPILGVAGFRARTGHILKGLEATTTKLYSSPDVLLGHILDLVGEAITAGNKLIEKAVPLVAQQFQIWQPHFEDWIDAEAKALQPQSTSLPDGLRYPGLVGERVARKILHECLSEGKFDSFLGPKKFKYRDSNFLNCHVFLLARALAFEEPPGEDEWAGIEIDPTQDPEKILFDAISAITARSEQPEAIELSKEILKRSPEWAFLRSFAAQEALFGSETVRLDAVKSSVIAESPNERAPAPVGVSLDELYSESSLVSPLAEIEPATPTPTTEPIRTLPHSSEPSKLGKDRCDPFESFKEYLQDSKVTEKSGEASAFDILGSSLGF